MLHFGWLDTVASDLDLLVHSAKELNLAVFRPVTSTVACPVCSHHLAVNNNPDKAIDVHRLISIPASEPVSYHDKLSDNT